MTYDRAVLEALVKKHVLTSLTNEGVVYVNHVCERNGVHGVWVVRMDRLQVEDLREILLGSHNVPLGVKQSLL